MAALWRMLDRAVAGIVAASAFLVLPLCLLLLLQWPLRDLLQAYSREANDLAQCLFALYVSVAITSATRQHTHLASDLLAQRYAPRTQHALARYSALLVLVPWALFILYAGWPMTLQSVLQQEAFPETFNPGYFVLKVALLVAALLVLLQAVLDIVRPSARPDA